jgi:hypothetical protein
MPGAEEVNAWRFGIVRLWEVNVEAALESGAAGLMALVPLLEAWILAASEPDAEALARRSNHREIRVRRQRQSAAAF